MHNLSCPRILILGDRSFVGSELKSVAVESGHRVLGWNRSDVDLLDEDRLREAFRSLEDETPTALVFCAVVNKTEDNSFRSFEQNVRMTKNVVENLPNTVRNVISISSVDVYGNSPRTPIAEDSLIAPDTWYGLAKFATEQVLRNELKIPVTILRIPGVYGPSPFDRSVIGRMIKSAKETGRITVGGDGTSVRDYVYVRDLAQLIIQSCEKALDSTFNVATGLAMTLNEIAATIKAVCAPSARIDHVPASPGREFSLVFDATKLKSTYKSLDFTPFGAAIAEYTRRG